MESIVEELPFTEQVKDALLGKPNIIHSALTVVLDHEFIRLEQLDMINPIFNISQSRFMELYIQAIHWVKTLE